MGFVVFMEKKNSEDFDFDVSVIIVVKVFLMGFIFGVGDLFFWGILRVIVVGIGIFLVSIGLVMGVVVFLFLYNILVFLIYYYSFYGGYFVGVGFIKKLYELGGIKIVIKILSMFGLMMVGLMIVLNVKFKIILMVVVKGVKEVVFI